MEEDYTATPSTNAQLLPGKSWIAYLGLISFGLAYLLLTALLSLFIGLVPGALLLVAGLAYVVYRTLEMQSGKLYYDDIGVWYYSGILPWKKGVSGVKWRDLDEAIYEQNFSSWLFKSYTIRIGHRFTKQNEIRLTHMHHGDQSVALINQQHKQHIRDGEMV